MIQLIENKIFSTQLACIQGVSKKKYPRWFLGFLSYRDTYGKYILIQTFHMTEIVKLAMIQAFTPHREMKIKILATTVNIGSMITSF